ncbi:serine/threonine-protein kinase pim-2-like [Erpetoichthys calabaricus]|uniref:serine/threonine-protein kinase pim-2-like n=1 Tax=Erpetoichthys calabaricus TaxID=27687 RepID=UPI002233FA76|nr:serine/threonine-protein kinase pim-2-like [Erpetoichthys calabaricus]
MARIEPGGNFRNKESYEEPPAQESGYGECSTACQMPLQPYEVPDWLVFLDDYEVESLLITGSFGGVYAARRQIDDLQIVKAKGASEDLDSKRDSKALTPGLYFPCEAFEQTATQSACAVSLKVISKDSVAEWVQIPGEHQVIPLEIALMKIIGRPPVSPGIIQLLDWCISSYNVFLVLERPEPFIELHDFVFKYEKDLEEPHAWRIFQQIVEALHHCLSRGVFHRDVKMNNILIQVHTCQIKLMNFEGASQLREGEYTTFRGALKYAPPEWFTKKRYEAAPATVWALGVVLYALVFGVFPFDTCKDTVKGNIAFPKNITRECRKLILHCLSKCPRERPSLEEILRHAWMI